MSSAVAMRWTPRASAMSSTSKLLICTAQLSGHGFRESVSSQSSALVAPSSDSRGGRGRLIITTTASDEHDRAQSHEEWDAAVDAAQIVRFAWLGETMRPSRRPRQAAENGQNRT